MKALNLKSISWIMAVAMMFIISFTGCSDDDDKGAVAVTFPELKKINCTANQTAEISFKAELDWEISSDKGWCKFVNGEFTETAMKGKAGMQTITIAISADGLSYEEAAVAEITMKMNDKSQVIYEVTRAKKEYSDLVVTDSEGNRYDKDHPLTIKGNSTSTVVYTSIKAEAETGMKIGFTNPAWLDYKINEETGMYEFTFKNDNEDRLSPKYSIAQGTYTLTFMTEDAATAETDKVRKVEIPLIYEGLQADAIAFAPTFMNATVSVDGQEITVGEETKSQLVSTITALDDKFEIVEITQTLANGAYEYDFSANGDLDWITTTKGTESDKDKITLTVTENTGDTEREAIVMVFPKAVYDIIKGDLKGNIIDSGTNDIKSAYNTNVIATLKQEKLQVQAERIKFQVKYACMSEFGSTSFMGLEENMSYVATITDLKETPNVSDYNVTNNNVWKATLPNSTGEMFSSSEMTLVFEAIGMATNQTITEKEIISGVHGSSVTGSSWSQEAGDMITINGWGIYFDNASSYQDNYHIVVKNENNEILALCIVEIAEQ